MLVCRTLLLRRSRISLSKEATNPLIHFSTTATMLTTKVPTPRVILGLMTFGPDPSTGARVTSLSDYNACLDTLQGSGYNEVDTARAYIGGAQEAFTRAAEWQRRGLTLATKCYPCLLYTSPSPRDRTRSRMPSSA